MTNSHLVRWRAAWRRASGTPLIVLALMATGAGWPQAAAAQAPSAPRLRVLTEGQPAPVLTVAVTPATVTLAPRATRQFAATASLDTAGPAVWAATGGTITQAGLYTAGTRPGTYEVVATRSGVSARATVVIQEQAAPPVTPDPEPTNPPSSGQQAYVWISPQELAARPTSGAAWLALADAARKTCATPDLANQDDPTNVCVMAKALVFARTGDTAMRSAVVAALESIVGSGAYDGRALALGRELVAYVIAADLIDLRTHNAVLDGRFRETIRRLLTAPTSSGPDTLVQCHEERPNNWGTHCGASRAAVAAYLGDTEELARVARVFRGWLGDRSAYAGFKFAELWWQCNPTAPVGINPKGCKRDGHSIDGVLADDQRRGGSFRWPAPKENYVYEALQGALVQAVILHRRGYDVFNWSDKALLRSFEWLHNVAGFPATSDDTWQPHLVNRFYGTTFPAPVPSRPGKNVGWTDWSHRLP